MSAVNVLLGRLTTEEGERKFPYDDATGLNVRAPRGNLSWGRGFDLMQCGSSGLFQIMESYLLSELDGRLQAYSWYMKAGDVRASVFLDVAYNDGLHGLLGYPSMIHYASVEDWVNAAAQCTEKDPKLDASRYAPLRQLLLTGVAS
jgi:hypothetical protein